jgi:hypothetical protein
MKATQMPTRDRRSAIARPDSVELERHRAADSEDEAADDLHVVTLPTDDGRRKTCAG